MELLIDTKQKRYELVKETLVRFPYLKRSKGEKGLLLKFLEKVSGYSYAGVKRFVRQYFETGQVAKSQGKERGFIRKYANADTSQLAETDGRYQIFCVNVIFLFLVLSSFSFIQ